MNLQEALLAAKEGHFVTNSYFGDSQSMHYYKGKYYYEDGAVVTREFLEKQKFAKGNSWSIKYDKSLIDTAILGIIHSTSGGLMLAMGSYEECIRNGK